MILSVWFYCRGDDEFDSDVQWQRRRIESPSRMAASIAQDADEEIRRTVEHLGSVVPARRGGDMSFDPDEVFQAVETTEGGPNLSEHVEGGESGRGTTFFFGEFSSNRSPVTKDTVLERKLPRDEQKICGAHVSRIVSSGFR